jgi:hypothetical protein
MRNDVIGRLAAANPVPTQVQQRVPAHSPDRRRVAIAAAFAVAVAVPAVAFAGALGNLLGISNEGSSVPTSSVLPGESRLDEALQSMNVGPTMQSLGTLNGVAFYATRNGGGDFCLAVDHVTAVPGKGVLCDLNNDNFPSTDVKAVSFPHTLLGVAADGVATVAFVDDAGNVSDSTPVVNNLFASDNEPTPQTQAAAYLETLNANGNVLTKQKLPR